MSEATPITGRDETRIRIVEAAAELLREHGPGAVTTRGVAEAAGVQAPTIYRLLGDKDGLLDAVAEHVMATFVSTKAETVRAAAHSDVDPLVDLRAGWRNQIDFGVANPTLFALLSDPERGRRSPAAQAGGRVLAARVHRLAAAGRLRVPEVRAVGLIRAAGTGAVLTILATPLAERDPGLADDLFEAVLRQILTDAPGPAVSGPVGAAVALRAVAVELSGLSGPERRLLVEWLDRAIAGPATPA